MNFFIKHKWGIYLFCIFTFVIISAGIIIVSYQTATAPSVPLLEALKAALLSIGGLGVVSTITLSVFNSIEDRYMKIIENTYSHITKWDDPHLATARKFTRKLKDTKPNTSDSDLIKQIDEDEDLKHSIVLVCNYFEQVRISYLMNRIDMKLFNKSLGPVMEDYNDRLKPYVASQGVESLKDWAEIRDLSRIR